MSVGGAPRPNSDPDDPDPRVRAASRLSDVAPNSDPDDPDPRHLNGQMKPPPKTKQPRKPKKAARRHGPAVKAARQR